MCRNTWSGTTKRVAASTLFLHARLAGRVRTITALGPTNQIVIFLRSRKLLLNLFFSQAARRRASLPDPDRDGALGEGAGSAPIGGVQRAQRRAYCRSVSSTGTDWCKFKSRIASFFFGGFRLLGILDRLSSSDFCNLHFSFFLSGALCFESNCEDGHSADSPRFEFALCRLQNMHPPVAHSCANAPCVASSFPLAHPPTHPPPICLSIYT